MVQPQSTLLPLTGPRRSWDRGGALLTVHEENASRKNTVQPRKELPSQKLVGWGASIKSTQTHCQGTTHRQKKKKKNSTSSIEKVAQKQQTSAHSCIPLPDRHKIRNAAHYSHPKHTLIPGRPSTRDTGASFSALLERGHVGTIQCVMSLSLE